MIHLFLTLSMVLFALILLTLAPSYIFALRMVRAKKLAEARCDLVECANRIQPYLASGEIACGTHTHDFTAMLINRAQYADKYLTFYMPWGARRKRVKELVGQMHKELRRQSAEFQAIYQRFIFAMWKAARYREPFTSAIIFVEILLRVAVEAMKKSSPQAFSELKQRAGDISTAACGVRIAPIPIR